MYVKRLTAQMEKMMKMKAIVMLMRMKIIVILITAGLTNTGQSN